MISIREGSIEDCLYLSDKIPEFNTQKKYDLSEYLKRLIKANHLILIAWNDKVPVGFKVGYQVSKEEFYTWMGGVLPEYRNKKIATFLAEKQESWCKKHNYLFRKYENTKSTPKHVDFCIEKWF